MNNDFTAFPRLTTIAHRAGNNPARARAAYEAGADLIEIDVWLYRGRLEVRHTKTMPLLPLLWDRWSLEPGWRPRLLLENLLTALPADAGIMLDLKGNAPRLPAAILQALHAQPRTGLVAICSQNWSHVDAFAGEPGIAAIHSAGKPRHLQNLLPHLARHQGVTPAGISIHQRLLTPDVVADLKRVAAYVITWPINNAARARELATWGVDGITTDDITVVGEIVAGRT
jgi:glycerophosphoryl diester phosphodiesterase